MEKNGVLRPYFAHTINLYETQLEESLLSLIADYFKIPEGFVENPNQPHHQEGYEAWAKRANQATTSHRGMNYFYDEVLPGCDGCVAMPFLDGRLGLGVAGETKWFIEKNLPTFLIFADSEVTPLSLRHFEADHRSGLFDIRPFTDEEKTLVSTNDSRIVVPHEETRLRVFITYGKEKRPFETAHLVTMPVPDGFYPEKKK